MYPYHLYDGVPRLEAHKTVSFINTDALEHNFKLLDSLIPSAKRICVVKADAYGHSTEICVPALIECGCDFFAVSCIEEALAVRGVCRRVGSDADILILGYTDPKYAGLLVKNDIIQTAVSLSHAQHLSESAESEERVLRVHIAVDTGMNRIGLSATSLEECKRTADEIEAIASMKNLRVEGMFTHFARSDEELPAAILQGSPTHVQGKSFKYIKELLSAKGISLFCHACNSAAAMRFPEYIFDGARLGITLYGVYPSAFFPDVGLVPVMSLSTVISHIHEVAKGGGIGYGGTYIAPRNTRVATLPIGYADGLLRKYSGASVTVFSSGGVFKAEIVGRICMDQCMIDIGEHTCSVGDRVIIFGQDPSSLKDLATRAETIEYECLCLVSARVPRINKKFLEKKDEE